MKIHLTCRQLFTRNISVDHARTTNVVHEETITKGTEYRVTKGTEFPRGAVVVQLASARLSEREGSGSILSDFNVCFDFPLIRVAIFLNTRKTEH